MLQNRPNYWGIVKFGKNGSKFSHYVQFIICGPQLKCICLNSPQDHVCRSEGIESARELDKKAAQAWVGHPYFDVVDNSTDFEAKVCRMIQVIIEGVRHDFGPLAFGEGDTVDKELRKMFRDEVLEKCRAKTVMNFEEYMEMVSAYEDRADEDNAAASKPVSGSVTRSSSSSSGCSCSFDDESEDGRDDDQSDKSSYGATANISADEEGTKFTSDFASASIASNDFTTDSDIHCSFSSNLSHSSSSQLSSMSLLDDESADPDLACSDNEWPQYSEINKDEN